MCKGLYGFRMETWEKEEDALSDELIIRITYNSRQWINWGREMELGDWEIRIELICCLGSLEAKQEVLEDGDK